MEARDLSSRVTMCHKMIYSLSILCILCSEPKINSEPIKSVCNVIISFYRY